MLKIQIVICYLREGAVSLAEDPASSAVQITPRQSSPLGSLVCAGGLPRRNLGFAEMKTGGGCFNSSE